MVCNRQHIPRTELKAGQALVLLTVWTQESKTFTPHRAESDTSHPAASSCHTAGLPPGPSPAASNTGVKPSRSQKAPCSPSDWSPSAKPVCSHLIANSTHRNKLAAVAVFMSGSGFPRRYSGTTAAPRLSPWEGCDWFTEIQTWMFPHWIFSRFSKWRIRLRSFSVTWFSVCCHQSLSGSADWLTVSPTVWMFSENSDLYRFKLKW